MATETAQDVKIREALAARLAAGEIVDFHGVKDKHRPAWAKWRKVDVDQLDGDNLADWTALKDAFTLAAEIKARLFGRLQAACDADIADDDTMPEGYVASNLNYMYGKPNYDATPAKKTASSGKRTVSRGLVIKTL